MFPLAFGLVPADRVEKVADFVQSRGMACSVYGAQYLLEALFSANRDDAAIQLMTSHSRRSWFHMIDSGSTTTWEAWDVQFKKNLTWNHAWGAAPANILSRYVLGIRPASPGYAHILIAPHVATLSQVAGKVPTPKGPVTLAITNTPTTFGIDVDLPPGARTTISLPRRPKGEVLLDGGVTPAESTARSLLALEVPSGRHNIESR